MEVDQVIPDDLLQQEIPGEGQQLDNPPAHPDHPQDTISFDQSGTTAEYLRHHSQDIVLTLEQVLQGDLGSDSSSSGSSSSVTSSALTGSNF